MRVQAAGVELAFEKLFKACAKNSYCRRRYPNLERAIFEQIEWLNIRPLPVTVTDPRNGEPVTIEVTGQTPWSRLPAGRWLSPMPDMPCRTIWRRFRLWIRRSSSRRCAAWWMAISASGPAT